MNWSFNFLEALCSQRDGAGIWHGVDSLMLTKFMRLGNPINGYLLANSRVVECHILVGLYTIVVEGQNLLFQLSSHYSPISSPPCVLPGREEVPITLSSLRVTASPCDGVGKRKRAERRY